MLNKPRCEKAQNVPGKLAIYCEGRNLCAHQYNCPQTRQYENTPDYRKCKRLEQPKPPQTAPVKFVVNVVPKVPEVPNLGTIAGAQPLGIKEEDVLCSGTLQTHTIKQAVTIGNETSWEAIPTPIYTKNVTPPDYGVVREPDDPAGPEKPDNKTTVPNTEVRKEKKNGSTVRNTRRRKTKKG